MSEDAEVMRTAEATEDVNTIVLPTVPIRFQIAPGTGAGLGIENAAYTITVNGTQYSTGSTNADGEVMVPLCPSGAVVRIFETEYTVTIHADGLVDITTLRGRQKRLDHLGYLTGYQLTPIASDVPDDGTDGPRTQQAIMNFQTDTNLTIDGDIGAQTEGQLRTDTHE